MGSCARGSRVDRRLVAVAAHPRSPARTRVSETTGPPDRASPEYTQAAARRAYRRSMVVPAAIGTTPNETSRGTGGGDVVDRAGATRTADAPRDVNSAPVKSTAYVKSLVGKYGCPWRIQGRCSSRKSGIAIVEYLPSDVRIPCAATAPSMRRHRGDGQRRHLGAALEVASAKA